MNFSEVVAGQGKAETASREKTVSGAADSDEGLRSSRSFKTPAPAAERIFRDGEFERLFAKAVLVSASLRALREASRNAQALQCDTITETEAADRLFPDPDLADSRTPHENPAAFSLCCE